MKNNIINKSEIRKICKAKRKDLSLEYVEKSSELICNNFLTNLLPDLLNRFKKPVFALYKSSYNEVNLDLIHNYLLEHNLDFSYPKIISENKELKFIKYHKKQKFVSNNIFSNIKEPENNEEILPNIILMPLVACDKNLNRVGMGKGFYDKTLFHYRTINHKFITIGLAYDFQLFNDIKKDEFDQSLDFIALRDNIIS